MTTRTREDLVADMERFATSLPGVMAADAQVALIVPGNLTDEETQRVAAAVPEGARISVFTDATRAGWSNGKKIVWGQNDGGLHDWRRGPARRGSPVAKPIPLDSSDDDLAASVRRTFDADGFFDALDAVRVQHQLTWRKVGEAAGVAPSTLTRMSQGRRPDVDSLAALVQWSGLRADDYLVGAVRQPAAERSGLEALTAHFRADPSLSPEAADILHDLVLNAYETLRKDR